MMLELELEVLALNDAIEKVKNWAVSLGVREGDQALVEERFDQWWSIGYAIVCRGNATMELALRIGVGPNAGGVLLFGLRRAGAKASRV